MLDMEDNNPLAQICQKAMNPSELILVSAYKVAFQHGIHAHEILRRECRGFNDIRNLLLLVLLEDSIVKTQLLSRPVVLLPCRRNSSDWLHRLFIRQQ